VLRSSPRDPEKQLLHCMPDVPHLLKNCLEKQTILLPDDIVASNNLLCGEVSMHCVQEIVNIQESFHLKPVHGLSRVNINPG
jgi:hypothetical protein